MKIEELFEAANAMQYELALDKLNRLYFPLMNQAGVKPNAENLANFTWLSNAEARKFTKENEKKTKQAEKKAGGTPEEGSKHFRHTLHKTYNYAGNSDVRAKDLAQLVLYVNSQVIRKKYPKKQDIVKALNWDEHYFTDLVHSNAMWINDTLNKLTDRNSDFAEFIAGDSADAVHDQRREGWSNSSVDQRKARIREIVQKIIHEDPNMKGKVTAQDIYTYNRYELAGKDKNNDTIRQINKYLESENTDMADVRADVDISRRDRKRT